jgi:hypothetical protein
MKTLRKLIMAVVLLATYAITFAQNDSKFESVQVKLMKMDDKFYIVLTDPQSNPYSNKNVTATGKATGSKITNPKLSLSTFGDNAFVINGTPGDFDKLKLTFHLKDAKANEYVYATLSNKNKDESAYVCPMHPGELMKSEGKCPKCGMGLQAKKVTVYTPSNVVRKGSR